jgi:hypothetical protein
VGSSIAQLNSCVYTFSHRYYLEEVDAKSPQECAQLCIDDAGCLSFDSGVPGLWQAGDCFLSYDNRRTTPAANFISVSQLNYYEKLLGGQSYLSLLFFVCICLMLTFCLILVFAVPILGIEYAARNGCYLAGNNQASYNDSYTAETCAHLCMNDPCCMSFDAGVGSNLYDCSISYVSASTTNSSLVCTPGANYTYYEPLVYIRFVLPGLSLSNIIVQQRLSNLSAAVISATSIIVQNVGTAVKNVTQASNGSPVFTLTFNTSLAIETVAAAIASGNLVVAFNSSQIRASFSLEAGPCPDGTVSASGNQPNCLTCRANTYV